MNKNKIQIIKLQPAAEERTHTKKNVLNNFHVNFILKMYKSKALKAGTERKK